MKLTLYSFALVVTTCLCACQKLVDWKVDPITKDVIGDTSRFNTEAAGILTAIVSVTGNETLQTNYTYDSLNQLVAMHHTGQVNGRAIDEFKRFYRDTLGRITTVADALKNNAGLTDTLFTQVWYDEDEPAFLRTVGTILKNGVKMYDSTLYTYDGNGHVGICNSFRKVQGALAEATLQQRQVFNYQNNNLVAFKNYSDSSGVLVLAENCRYEYDLRVNPLYLKNDAFIVGKLESVSKNNVLKLETAGPTSAQFDTRVTNLLIYGSRSKPLSGRVAHSNGITSTLTFTYR